MDEANLTRRDALAQAGKVALGSALVAGPLGAALAQPAKARPRCHESTKKIISIAAVAEALAVTFYYNGITRKVGTLIKAEQLDYLKAALAQEKHHLELLRSAGAAQPPHTFYFDPATFRQVKHFTAVLDALETAFIGAYAAAVHRFCQLNRADLAELASRILGIEAEHRVLGRDIAGASPPNNLCLERTPFECVSGAAKALAPFLSAGSGQGCLQAAERRPGQGEGDPLQGLREVLVRAAGRDQLRSLYGGAGLRGCGAQALPTPLQLLKNSIHVRSWLHRDRL